MHPDRQVVRGHAGEDRPELGRAQRLAGDVGEDLDAARAEAFHRAVDLGERGLDVVHRQRRDERREAVGVPAAKLGQRVVGEPRELRRLVGGRDQLERRIGEREHLLQPVELVEQGEPRIDVPQRLEPRERGDGDMTRNDLGQAVEIRLGHEMIEDVDDHKQDEPRERESRATVKAKQIICYSARVAGRAA